jgi:formylglycine-generating enzyme required for sulfatase activity
MATHLGGRYQPDMAEDIAQRLAAITVDVDSVVVENVADELDSARTLPLPTVDAQAVAEGEFTYTTTLSLPAGEMTIGATRTIERQADASEDRIVISTTSRTPMGELSDRYVIDGTSLRPIRRTVDQGPTKVEVAFDAREVGGAITMQGNEIPIRIELDAPVFGSDAALELALAGIELRDGLRTRVRFAEVGAQQRVRYFQAEVTGPETIQVPDGEFETFRVSLTAIDGEGGDQTYWITADAPRHTVRIEGSLPPQMGGGRSTTVLGTPVD